MFQADMRPFTSRHHYDSVLPFTLSLPEGRDRIRTGHLLSRQGGGIRTHGLLSPRQARYQAALHPEIVVSPTVTPSSSGVPWSGWRESNSLSPASEAGGLPFSNTQLVAHVGLEPTTSCMSYKHSTNQADGPYRRDGGIRTHATPVSKTGGLARLPHTPLRSPVYGLTPLGSEGCY